MVSVKGKPEARERNSEGVNPEATKGDNPNSTDRKSEVEEDNPEVAERNPDWGKRHQSINPCQKHENFASKELLTRNMYNKGE